MTAPADRSEARFDAHDMVAALLVRQGRVLLCHRTPTRSFWPDVWDLPGGHVDPGEPAAAALRRELEEELAVKVEALDDRPDLDHRDGALRLRIWVLRDWTGEPRNVAPEEHDAVRWFPVDRALTLPLAHPVYGRLLERVAAHDT